MRPFCVAYNNQLNITIFLIMYTLNNFKNLKYKLAWVEADANIKLCGSRLMQSEFFF